MSSTGDSILLLGESGVGKTHYGAQLLRRLMKGDCRLRMNGQATNLESFEAALESLSEGKAADHTATSTYVDSVWPVSHENGASGQLIWPEYGGEQIRSIIDSRRVSSAWRNRAQQTNSWMLMIRLQQTQLGDDILSRPLLDLRKATPESPGHQISDQARLIELLQILMHTRIMSYPDHSGTPQLVVLLSCWDELEFDGTPSDALRTRLPMFWSYLSSSWRSPFIMGLSALGRPLTPHTSDSDYSSRGPEHFGFVVTPDGAHSPDLTLPIHLLLDERKQQGAD
ncbi:hypothetical protein ABZ922_33970 [Streptomyces shenzhenensis]|uniref:TRAFAC clade GTPase domain-containing protein n=1 Tax=Streptomyces shenzhenensis TaxID=943815 RepID=UPI0033EA30A0